jgi:hypothetical protein
MTVLHSPRWTRAAAPAVVLLALGAGLAGCRDGGRRDQRSAGVGSRNFN